MADEMAPPTGECTHCPKPATKWWRLLGGNGPMGFGYRPVCDSHYEIEREERNDALRAALEGMRRG